MDGSSRVREKAQSKTFFFHVLIAGLPLLGSSNLIKKPPLPQEYLATWVLVDSRYSSQVGNQENSMTPTHQQTHWKEEKIGKHRSLSLKEHESAYRMYIMCNENRDKIGKFEEDVF